MPPKKWLIPPKKWFSAIGGVSRLKQLLLQLLHLNDFSVRVLLCTQFDLVLWADCPYHVMVCSHLEDKSQMWIFLPLLQVWSCIWCATRVEHFSLLEIQLRAVRLLSLQIQIKLQQMLWPGNLFSNSSAVLNQNASVHTIIDNIFS